MGDFKCQRKSAHNRGRKEGQPEKREGGRKGVRGDNLRRGREDDRGRAFFPMMVKKNKCGAWT